MKLANRFNGNFLAAIMTALLGLFGIQSVSGQQSPAEYKITDEKGESVYRILTSKSEIENKLWGEVGLVPAGMPDLSKVPWHQITKWRLDPVVSEPLKSKDDIRAHADELAEAVEQNVILPPDAKAALKGKIRAGDCTLGQIRSRFFEAMVNRASIVWKGEVAETLATTTQACEFFLSEHQLMVSVVMDCGNFTFFFNSITFTAKIEVPPPTPKTEVTPPPAKVIPPVEPVPEKPKVTLRLPPPITPKVDKPHKRWPWVIVAIVGVGAAGGVLASRGHGHQPPEPFKNNPAIVGRVP